MGQWKLQGHNATPAEILRHVMQVTQLRSDCFEMDGECLSNKDMVHRRRLKERNATQTRKGCGANTTTAL